MLRFVVISQPVPAAAAAAIAALARIDTRTFDAGHNNSRAPTRARAKNTPAPSRALPYLAHRPDQDFVTPAARQPR
jgi:hypothetical protein